MINTATATSGSWRHPSATAEKLLRSADTVSASTTIKVSVIRAAGIEPPAVVISRRWS